MNSEFITIDAVQSFSTQVLIVTVVANSLRFSFGVSAKKSGLIVAFVLAVASFSMSSSFQEVSFQQVLVGIWNAFLVYSTAFGIAKTTGRPDNLPGDNLGNSRKLNKSSSKPEVDSYDDDDDDGYGDPATGAESIDPLKSSSSRPNHSKEKQRRIRKRFWSNWD